MKNVDESEAARAEYSNITLPTQEEERRKDEIQIESGFIEEMFSKFGKRNSQDFISLNIDDYQANLAKPSENTE